MEAKAGDEIVVDARATGGALREGEIVEIRAAGDVLHYLVRWDDGHETIFYPGSDAHVVRLGRRSHEMHGSP
ncbi:MAG TPA: DUF1918 domain-containing protein [Acidimicrobiia bacterium]|jgi:hypothetical protein|nr:DUF1918 domain-containing protein [Acidimicrobiia bacterium]